MKRFFTKKGALLITIAIIIAVVTTISLSVAGNPGFISNSVEIIVKPIKITAASVAKAFESVYGYIYEYDQLADENSALKAELVELEQEHREYTEILEENERLRKLQELSVRHSDFEYDNATIISWSSSNWDSSFTISKGSSNSDVEKGDSIITETGVLVGRVTNVGLSTSTCITVIDTTFSASTLIESSGDTVVAQGDFSLMQDGLLELEYVSDGTEMFAGDAVVTSGKGGIFPKGLLIGYVTEVIEDDSGLGIYATVEPTVSLKDTMYIYIITDIEITE